MELSRDLLKQHAPLLILIDVSLFVRDGSGQPHPEDHPFSGEYIFLDSERCSISASLEILASIGFIVYT